ncbi:MAG: hypothetical protein ACI4NM_00935 [Bullifex sp.]
MRTFRISDGRKAFFQWDADQKLLIGANIPVCAQVHFCNASSTQALVVEVKEDKGTRYCDVPNILLQEASPIRCYTYRVDDGHKTTHESIFEVIARNKPYDYVYTETEVLRYEELEEKINMALASINAIHTITNEDIDTIMKS